MARKRPQNDTPKRHKNDEKHNTKKEQRKDRKRTKQKQEMMQKPDKAMNGKRRIQTFFVIIKRFCMFFVFFQG